MSADMRVEESPRRPFKPRLPAPQKLYLGAIWVWLGLVGFFAVLSGMASDGCEDSTCDARVGTAWVVLMAVQAAIVVGAGLAGKRVGSRLRLVIMSAAAVVSPLTVAAFLSYADTYT